MGITEAEENPFGFEKIEDNSISDESEDINQLIEETLRE